MSRSLLVVALCFSFISGVAAQSIPQNLRGKWRVRRILPADTISCWGDREAKRLLGTEIEYAITTALKAGGPEMPALFGHDFLLLVNVPEVDESKGLAGRLAS